MKLCTECGIEKSNGDFHPNKSSPDLLHSKCKECKNARSREYYKRNKERVLKKQRKSISPRIKKGYSSERDARLQRRYGITEEQYNQLLTKQQNRCMICYKHEKDSKIKLAVDHNHKTGEIRGLLCNYCNHRLVGRHTDGTLLRKIADYIEQGTGWFVPDKKKRK